MRRAARAARAADDPRDWPSWAGPGDALGGVMWRRSAATAGACPLGPARGWWNGCLRLNTSHCPRSRLVCLRLNASLLLGPGHYGWTAGLCPLKTSSCSWPGSGDIDIGRNRWDRSSYAGLGTALLRSEPANICWFLLILKHYILLLSANQLLIKALHDVVLSLGFGSGATWVRGRKFRWLNLPLTARSLFYGWNHYDNSMPPRPPTVDKCFYFPIPASGKIVLNLPVLQTQVCCKVCGRLNVSNPKAEGGPGPAPDPKVAKA